MGEATAGTRVMLKTGGNGSFSSDEVFTVPTDLPADPEQLCEFLFPQHCFPCYLKSFILNTACEKAIKNTEY